MCTSLCQHHAPLAAPGAVEGASEHEAYCMGPERSSCGAAGHAGGVTCLPHAATTAVHRLPRLLTRLHTCAAHLCFHSQYMCAACSTPLLLDPCSAVETQHLVDIWHFSKAMRWCAESKHVYVPLHPSHCVRTRATRACRGALFSGRCPAQHLHHLQHHGIGYPPHEDMPSSQECLREQLNIYLRTLPLCKRLAAVLPLHSLRRVPWQQRHVHLHWLQDGIRCA